MIVWYEAGANEKSGVRAPLRRRRNPNTATTITTNR